MNIILFGFKGSGKTHLGKLLSLKLNRPFIDTDDLICNLYSNRNLKIRDIHHQLGESAFRALENKAIHTLNANSHAIIALGGGAILDPSNMIYLQKIGKLIYLKVSFTTARKRIYETPSFASDEASLSQIYHKRLPLYESIPAICLDVDLLDETDCIKILLENL